MFLGVETPRDALLASVARHRPRLVALGATGPGSGQRLADAVAGLRQLAPAMPIVVGGAEAKLAAQVIGDPSVHVADDATTVVAVVGHAIEMAGVAAAGGRRA
jgi:hypothetical protein